MINLLKTLQTEFIKEIIKYYLPQIILIISTTIISFTKLLNNITLKIFLIICVLLFLIIINLIIYIFKINNKIKKLNSNIKLKFDNKIGCYYDNEGQYYCTSCFLKNIYSPLKHTKRYYKCMMRDCEKEYTISEETIIIGGGKSNNDFKS